MMWSLLCLSLAGWYSPLVREEDRPELSLQRLLERNRNLHRSSFSKEVFSRRSLRKITAITVVIDYGATVTVEAKQGFSQQEIKGFPYRVWRIFPSMELFREVIGNEWSRISNSSGNVKLEGINYSKVMKRMIDLMIF